MTPTLERKLMLRMGNNMFVRAARLVSAHFRLPFPPKLLSMHFASSMGLVLTAFQGEQLGGRDLAVSVNEMVEGTPALWEMASMMSETKFGGAAILRDYREKREEAILNIPNCWSSPPLASHGVPLQFTEITSEQQMSDARAAIVATTRTIHIVYRNINRPTFNPYFAAMMWQFHGSEEKFWINCLNPPKDLEELVEALIGKAECIYEAGIFQAATFNTFNISLPNLCSIPTPKHKSAKVPRRMATVQHKRQCLATRQRVIRQREDMDACFLYHLA